MSQRDNQRTTNTAISGAATMRFRDESVPIALFGEMGKDFGAAEIAQMEKAARLPVAVKAAIMPDGHPGYALPIGGVIGLDNAVSPSFVGYDIACRMMLTILDIPPEEFMVNREKFTHDMRAVTSFGVGSDFKGKSRRDHAVMEDPLWDQIGVVRNLKGLAWNQLGSSGGGNHFMDAVIGEVLTQVDWLPRPVGSRFVGILTHSGSRGTGNKLAQHYQKLATHETQQIAQGIPNGYEWLSLSGAGGQEYWQVMQLMGRYAQANHTLIHDIFLQRSGLKSAGRWENHHNFAFEENGMIVHRKGATPAMRGRIGLIPGSSGTASYLVEGLGNTDSLDSSSHGAGRLHSRTECRRLYDESAFTTHMRDWDILGVGIQPDETFQAYKDIEHVMSLQEGRLVRSIARMKPVVVLMGGRADDGD